MTHPITLTIVGFVLVLGLGLGFAINARRDEIGTTPLVELSANDTAGETRFGFVTEVAVSGDRYYLGLDEATWVTGEAAVDAAVRAGLCDAAAPETCTPNDFFIENPEREVAWYPMSDSVTIVLQTLSDAQGNQSEAELSLDAFRDLFTTAQSVQRWRSTPFWVRFESGAVTALQEQYVP